MLRKFTREFPAGYLSATLAAELETEIKQVGAPLAGLIRSERLATGMTIGGAIVVVLFLSSALS